MVKKPQDLKAMSLFLVLVTQLLIALDLPSEEEQRE